VSNELAPIPSVADTALRDASGSATRGTLRASAVKKTGAPETFGSTVTFAAEQSVLWDKTLGDLPASSLYGPGPGGPQRNVTGLSSNSGISSQVDLAWRNSTYLTGGLRFELIDPSRAPAQLATLPMLGGAWVRDFALATLKLRAAYGRGIRAPQSTLHVVTREPRRTIANPVLEPEKQSGIEVGADLFLGRMLGVHITRFDQRASGLIQTVTIGDTSSSNSGPGGGEPRYWFQLQNVGEITNRGWESQATIAAGPISISAAGTLVDSRVQRVARAYTGDLMPGDRMLAVPARTVSGTLAWVRRGLQLSSTIARASDWVNYDRLAIAQAWLNAGGDGRAVSGNKLRTFWVKYPGATRLRASASYGISRGLTLSATGENLLNYQRGEPDTITIVPGRTITLGVRARF
jgi:iron complex outermembrane receptor protein